jgi:DNA polymerase-3 subunit epsilon
MEISVLQATLQAGILHQQTHLINPGVPIPAKITEFTGITQAMVDRASEPEPIWQAILPLLNQGILTAHNLRFDYGFIQSECDRLDIVFSRPVTEQLCTVILSRLMLPNLPSRSLPNLVRHFGFDVGRSHRAEADTQACWLLAKRLLTEILNESDDVLLPRFAKQWLTLGDTAVLMRCTGKQARSRLHKAGIEPRLVGHHQNPTYQRGDVERVFLEQKENSQLSWL